MAVKNNKRTLRICGNARSQCVYFIQAANGGPIKIGKATNPISRMRELQTSFYEQFRIVGIIKLDYTIEADIHEEFSEFRLRGEWFAPCQKLLSFIAVQCTTGEGDAN